MISPLLGTGGLFKYIFLGILSGIFSFAYIHYVTQVLGLITSDNYLIVSYYYAIIFVIITCLFILTRRVLASLIIKLSGTIFWMFRKDILTAVLNASHKEIIKKKSSIDAAILSDVDTLTQASTSVIDFFTAIILSIACFIYLASISLVLFVLTIVVTVLGSTIYQLSANKNIKGFEKARKLENDFFDNYTDIIGGFKEIYMEPKKGKYIYNHKIYKIANEAYENNVSAYKGFLNNQIIGQVLFYILISSILIFWSLQLKLKPSETVTFIFTLLYLLGAIETVLTNLPNMIRAKVAANNLLDLKDELECASLDNIIAESYIEKSLFDNITVNALEFHYSESGSAFGIGPVDFEINKGEVIFIYGGNGSGKTTFVNNILGISKPTKGQIRLNGELVHNGNYSFYRSAFAVVFSDFYLFKEIMGIDHINIEKWTYYLKLFELEGKIVLDNGHFSTTNLSTGQKKRLALIVALLEEKPVLVIDEWAADQDPYFRNKFYTEILPILKNNGIAVLAITHDDKFYNTADKLLKMYDGNLILETNFREKSNVL